MKDLSITAHISPMQTKELTISVIVPVYNQERYVRKCLRSILQQDIRDIEIVVIDDGSTDNSLAIIKNIAAQDGRIVIIEKKNEGVSYARRDGLKAARGKYISFVDSDDYLPPHALKILYDILIREDVDIVMGACIRQMGLYKRRGRRSEQISERRISLPELWDDLYISYFGISILPVQMWGRLYKKEVIDKAMTEVPLFSKTVRSMGEDDFFNLMLHPYIKSMYISNAHVYVYRYGGITAKYNPHISELFDFSDYRLKLLDQYQYIQGYNALFIEYKNYIFSDINQRMEYLHESREQITHFLHEELGRREVFKRMQTYYKDKQTGEEMAALLQKDMDQIWYLACKPYDRGRKRRCMKKCIQFLFS